jgi:hypothetical protein
MHDRPVGPHPRGSCQLTVDAVEKVGNESGAARARVF